MKCLFFLWCAMSCNMALQAQYNQVNLKLDQPANGNPYKFLHLQLYPIRANDVFRAYHRNNPNYVTLKEALEKNKVMITEMSQGGSVNTLYIENISHDTIIVLSGEVVQGGKQDRVIAQDFVLYPRSGKKDVSVFCVEHGRWQTKDDGASFKQYYSISSNEVRKAATVKKDQREVWDKVAVTTEKNRASSSTGALTELKNSVAYTADLRKYVTHFQALLSNETDVIGVVAVSGNNILGCDMFASHEMFVQYLPNLLNSYATEAMTSGGEVNVPYDKVKKYLDGILSDETKQETEIPKNGAVLKDGKKKIHLSTF